MEKAKEKETEKKIVNLGNDVLGYLKKARNPDINLPIRALSNIYFDEKHKLIRLGNKVSHRTYLNVAHTRKFMQTLMIASECKKIINQGVTSPKKPRTVQSMPAPTPCFTGLPALTAAT